MELFTSVMQYSFTWTLSVAVKRITARLRSGSEAGILNMATAGLVASALKVAVTVQGSVTDEAV